MVVGLGSSQVTSAAGTAGVAAGSFTTGGLPALVTINPGTHGLDILAGLGGYRFADPAEIPTASSGRAVVVADFNGDGISDVALLGPGTSASISATAGEP